MSTLEKEFNQKAKQIQIEPSVSAWPTLNERMNIKKKKRKSNVIHFKLYSLVVTIIIILLLCLITFWVVKTQLANK